MPWFWAAGSMMALSIAVGGWASNLIVFLITEFHVKSISATKISNVVLACSSLFPIAGAIIADSFFGSFPVVRIFAFVSLLVFINFVVARSFSWEGPTFCTSCFNEFVLSGKYNISSFLDFDLQTISFLLLTKKDKRSWK